VLYHRSLHACVLNSRALSLAGINLETPEPPGALFERDLITGELTGLLFEMLSYIRSDVMPPLSETEFNHGIALVNQYFLSRGITSLQDATVVNDYGRWQVYRQLIDNYSLRSRLYFMPGIDNIGQFREAGMLFGNGDNKLRLGGVKIMLTESIGTLYPGQTELYRQALDIDRAGFQLAIHAEEPSTVEAAITALEYVKAQSSALLDRRHRIEHCSECPPHLMERLKVLKPVIVTQPPFLFYNGERYLATMSTEQIRWLFRTGSWFENGLVVAGSSDSPVVPANPIDGLYAAVTRKAQSGQQITPEECISADQALAMYTCNAAYASFEEDIKGSIIPGKLADMVLLSDDPTSVSPENIKDIKVEMTVIGGEIVWEG
jgi:predicted amidohydrolase YtcJ